MMTIKEELFDQIEELNTSLRELTDYELVDCRNALINRTNILICLLYTSPSPRDRPLSRMPSSA